MNMAHGRVDLHMQNVQSGKKTKHSMVPRPPYGQYTNMEGEGLRDLIT